MPVSEAVDGRVVAVRVVVQSRCRRSRSGSRRCRPAGSRGHRSRRRRWCRPHRRRRRPRGAADGGRDGDRGGAGSVTGRDGVVTSRGRTAGAGGRVPDVIDEQALVDTAARPARRPTRPAAGGGAATTGGGRLEPSAHRTGHAMTGPWQTLAAVGWANSPVSTADRLSAPAWHDRIGRRARRPRRTTTDDRRRSHDREARRPREFTCEPCCATSVAPLLVAVLIVGGVVVRIVQVSARRPAGAARTRSWCWVRRSTTATRPRCSRPGWTMPPQLYREGVAPRIMTIGGGQTGDRTTEGAAGARVPGRPGIDESALTAVGTGDDTLVSLRAADVRADRATGGRRWCW